MIYYYPNKPILIHPNSSIVLEKSLDSNWWAEIKKNGTRLCLRKDKNNYTFWNRHKEILDYQPTLELIEELNSIKIPDGTQIDAELMHQKTKHIKHFIYIYDIYWYKGEQVLEPLSIRRKMLEDLFYSSYKNFELTKNYSGDFLNLFNKVIVQEENEGLVLKNKNGIIKWDLKKCPEVSWQLKIRKTSKSYQF
jgi:ATP-dependent DNA ligase